MFSHLDSDNQPTMVDISGKDPTDRIARATAKILLPAEVRNAMVDGEIQTAKGPVFQTAIVAGTMAAKKTHELIPFCHPLGLESCKIAIRLDQNGDAIVDCETRVHHKTGVEMEALTGASVAALTIYDMCKGLSHDIVVSDIRLVSKSGGKSDYQAAGSEGQSGAAGD